MEDNYYITSATRNKIKEARQGIKNGTRNLEELVYDIQENHDGKHFGYTLYGSKPVPVKLEDYEYMGKMLDKECPQKKTYDLWMRKND